MLASELGVTDVLDLLEVQLKLEGTVKGDEFWLLCPVPGHDDTHASCSVNVVTGYWKCLSCGKGGDILRLGEIVLGVGYQEILERIKPNTVEALLNTVNYRLTVLNNPKVKDLIVPPASEYDNGPYDDLIHRGFDSETLKRWNVKFLQEARISKAGGDLLINQSYALPIRQRNNSLLGWCYRRTDASYKWMPKYLYTPGISLKDIWFGVNYHADAKHIVIVEGALDTMWLDQYGIPALGMLGSTNVSQSKANFLRRYQTVTLLGDRDAAGVASVHRIGQMLQGRANVRVARYRTSWTATDPQELTEDQLAHCVARAIPWNLFLTHSPFA